MFLADTWTDYEVLDTGDGEKLERWGDIILRRPDPQTIWPKAQEQLWKSAQAHYHRSDRGGGEWELMKKLPEDHWILINLQGIALGREICKAPKPRCGECFLTEYCRYYQNQEEDV